MPPEVLAPEIEEVTQEPSLRETIEKAVDASVDTEAPGQGVQPDAGQPSPAGKGEAKQTPDLKPEGAKPAAPAGTPAAPAGQPGAVTPPAELKAPSQWRPAVREKWNTLPREVQEEVLRREGDALRLIGSVGQKIRMADEVNQHMAPFAERLQATGASPQAFLGDVFQTVKSLSGGTNEEKAAVIANIIQSYGVDLNLLDSVLSSRLRAPPPSPEVIRARQMAAQAQAVLHQQEVGQVQQKSQAAEQVLTEFGTNPKNEFFEDVRSMMADLLEAGRANTLDEAYTACIWANPDTRKILLQREAEQRAGAKHQRANAARLASSSIHGTPRGPGAAPGIGANLSLRDTIAAAMDAQESA